MSNSKLTVIKRDSPNTSPHGKLATFFRRIARANGGVKGLLQALSRNHSYGKSTKNEITNTNALIKEMTSDTMTLATFIKLIAIRFIPKRIVLHIEIIDRKGDTLTYSIPMKITEKLVGGLNDDSDETNDSVSENEPGTRERKRGAGKGRAG